MACPNPYIRPIGGCSASITLDLGLQPETEYTFVFTFKGGRQEYVTYIPDIDGEIVMEQGEDIAGFWTYADEYVTFQVFESLACEPLIFTICDVEYDTLGFEFIGTSATTPSVFSCECTEI